MKSNRGVTLTSLIIYVIGFTIVLTLLTMFTNNFSKNLNDVTVKESSREQYLRVMSFMTNDINSSNLEFVKLDEENGNYVIMQFKGNVQHQYLFENNFIYYIKKENDEITKKIVLCQNVAKPASRNVFIKTNEMLDTKFLIESDEFQFTLNVNLII